MGRGRVDDRVKLQRFARSNSSGGGGAAKHPITFDEGQVGRKDDIGGYQLSPSTITVLFVEEPRHYSARLRVQIHRSPRISSSRSCTIREGSRRDGRG